ncbi:MAG: diadenylate cyclase [Candidatus Izimaplasma sp.]|nr:diadenylate cyclase [Candidatus Izimaplasma bacterium]
MSNFDIIAINIYLIVLIINILKNKTIIQVYRFFKFIIFVMFVFAIAIGIEEVPLLDLLIKGIPLLLLVGLVLEPEISLVLKKLGIFGSHLFSESIEDHTKNEILKSIDFMSTRNIGALITFEKNASLEEFVKTAYPVNTKLSHELLSTIFVPETPLHDGGVIIRGDKIICAGAYYPPTDRLDIPKQLGSRHRAAIGVSEISDALTIVVSEQTGNISVAFDGYLDLDIDKETLVEYLEKYLQVNK